MKIPKICNNSPWCEPGEKCCCEGWEEFDKVFLKNGEPIKKPKYNDTGLCVVLLILVMSAFYLIV